MPASFVHLRVHTEYSLVNGTVRIKPLVKQVADAGMPAVAVTDQCNLFSMVKFYRAAMAHGVKPIIGVDVWIAEAGENVAPSKLVLLCKSRAGYLNLTRLVSRSYIEGQHRGMPTIEACWLDGHSDGLIALSGGMAGNIGRALLAGKPGLAAELLDEWQRLFPDSFYLELQRTGRSGEQEYLHKAVTLATQKDVPVVGRRCGDPALRSVRERDHQLSHRRLCSVLGGSRDEQSASGRSSGSAAEHEGMQVLLLGCSDQGDPLPELHLAAGLKSCCDGPTVVRPGPLAGGALR